MMNIGQRKMKALILAAGLGTRLWPITADRPKAMVPVNGQPVLLKQIENLHKNGIYDITIISGYRADVIKEVIQGRFPEIQILESADYDTTNNMYSAYLAKNIMSGQEFLMMNGDVFFDASVIEALLEFDAPDAIVTDIGTYLEESMKVVEKEGYLIEISKEIPPEDALGASIDVYKFSVDGGRSFFAKCAEYIEERKELKKWSEVALNDILKEIKFTACPLNGRWFEIDTLDDLAKAEALFKD